MEITVTPGWIPPERRRALRDGAPPASTWEREYLDGLITARVNRLRGDGRRG